MPPKGWRKTAEGYKPTNSAGAPVTDRKVYGLKDLLLPRATIAQLAKVNLPEGAQLPKDGVTALQRAATVFVSYICTEANRSAQSSRHKTVSAPDIDEALQHTGFTSFVQPSSQLADKMAKKAQENKQERQQKRTALREDGDSEYEIEEDPDPEITAAKEVQPAKKRTVGASNRTSRDSPESHTDAVETDQQDQGEPMSEL